ncbi:hypothetical protein KUTeg_011223 [Tegillarca granosa]|uniref:Uncharacterized protein n=1 Tax=Tegillarca granosa TaxID=220873 RepID=A0ABQ9F1E3_TEGGR|nr:hypothetical protein KUTeg_011223 [Tegillarca granosa]
MTQKISNLLPSRKTANNTLMVAAIDFGTTYSGVAYSLCKDFGKIPLFIDTLNWDKSGLISMKTPTSLLLDPCKQFAAFGYKAEEQYNELFDEDNHREWFYFKQFKMILHHEETLNRNTVLQDVNGHELPALEVFSHSIRYLIQQLHARLDEKGADVRDDDIYWILTVPAIWNDPAKQFMREAAENAGIPGEQLSLALEPEVASIYVKEMCVQRHESKGEAALEPFSPGTKYMVLDLGGGTVDITVREVLEDRTLKELHKATGSDWGGLSINKAFLNVLEDLFGTELIEEFKDKCKTDYYEFESDIEMKKRTIKIDQSTKVSIHCPSGLRQIFESKKGLELKNVKFDRKDYVGKVDMKHDKLRLDPKLAESLFDRTAEAVTKDVKDILSFKTTHGLKNIICVGGFAECDIFISKIKERLPEYNIMVPQDAGLAVLKGAVLYGQNPKIVSSRIIRYTYGNAVHRLFFGDFDPPEKFVSVGGVPYCKDVFNILIEVDTEYEVGGKVTTEVMPLKADMTKMSVHLYRSKEKKPEYVTDKGCENLGTIVVDMPDTSGGLNRKVLVSLTFGDTELTVEGRDETTGKSVLTTLDLLAEK